jgi:multidrug efflux pump subunit AcrA (membrane-fusion protein)
MFTRLRIVTEVHENALVIPRRALSAEAGNFVWVINPGGGSASPVEIVTGLFDRDEVEVLSGLSAEDLVIVEGHSAMTEKSKINIVNPERDRPRPVPNSNTP